MQAPEVTRQLFGGVLDVDGAGLYPGLELLNLVFSVEGMKLLPHGERPRFRRRSHEFARKLVWDDAQFHDHQNRESALYGDHAEYALRHLLRCLALPIPRTSKTPSWERSHLYPYTRTLIHWDARKPRRRGVVVPQMERRYLRGGGALAHKVLRTDPDCARLERIRTGLEELYGGHDSGALERLAVALDSHGLENLAGEDAVVVEDAIEQGSSEEPSGKHGLASLYRDGVMNITSHVSLSSSRRIESLLLWTGFWLVIVEAVLSQTYLEKQVEPLVIDCGAGAAQVRRASQRRFSQAQTELLDAANALVKAAGTRPLALKQKDKIRGFFWATAATIGLLNSWTGRRHFTLGLDLLQALVLASMGGGSETTFETFMHEFLYGRCHLVVARRAAEEAGLLEQFDGSIFEDNEEALARRMRAAGLLHEYSDATRMVGTESFR